ncbi:MAG: hypothetical protein JW742_09640, partial [Candidatus Aminicenantes bacterium]|nr:hypothetical protein [Candidatus Aminicenantes bacterium]
MRKSLKISLAGVAVLFAAALFGAPSSRDGNLDGAAAWQPVGPEGGAIMAIEPAGNNKNDLLALTGGGYTGPSFIYRTRNGGSSWTRSAKIKDGLTDLV